jgi:hypothetical protein
MNIPSANEPTVRGAAVLSPQCLDRLSRHDTSKVAVRSSSRPTGALQNELDFHSHASALNGYAATGASIRWRIPCGARR